MPLLQSEMTVLVHDLDLEDCVPCEINALTSDLNAAASHTWIRRPEHDKSPVIRALRKAAKAERQVVGALIPSVQFRRASKTPIPSGDIDQHIVLVVGEHGELEPRRN